jgi:glycosyltransferase involved in cell wall biosynthesis
LAASKDICIAILTDLGTDHRCFKVVSSLKDLGYDPIIYCDRPRNPLSKDWEAFRVRPLTRTSHFNGFGKAFLPFLLGLTRPVWTSQAKTWMVLDCPPLFWVALLGRLSGKQVIYDSHEIFLKTPLVQGRLSRRLFWRFWHDGGMAMIGKMIAVSPLSVEYFREHYPGKKVHLLPNAPRPTPAPTSPKPGMEGGIALIFQGGLRVATGLEETMAAMALQPSYRLEIFGFGPEEADLKRKAETLRVDKRVRFHGAIPFSELRPHMEAAHIGLHLMQPICDSFALTLANKLFDYVHALTPVLLSDNPAHRDFLARYPVGVAVDSFSPEAIRKGLETLAADLEGYRAACAKAREEWQWDRFAGGLKDFLEA